ncbi:uncharacterized protein LOC127252072 [Andrographis paniculata]|uniref:uncharacterized protein LOC127252072 n=1 Tax=Andrographis paniculata TaxID=175694 RepID=UPI0021E6E715|nr:uncharacterized protein LOC127252072 [Andrographis paniculata]XP_051132037.1 uncharacterized protein LOC127252072 [Andrographis paniculata]XP_051132038.1 uncharacterized protein LOC127252072 [Andrographis paniculata]
MSRQGRAMMESLMGPTKIRKRGCSSSSSSSSRIHNKRAILRGKNRAGLGIALGRSRSGTPAPAWRTTPLRSAVDSPKHSQSGKSTRPVSARRLAATLWEMNEMPSPAKMSESNLELMKHLQKKKNGNHKMVSKKEKLQPGWGLHISSGSGSGHLPPHLSDPSYSPSVSEKLERRRTPSQRITSAEQIAGAFDSISRASFMEIESRSRPPTSSGSVNGCRSRLKDVSNALTTSKELLKIITRISGHSDQNSSSMSLISALHAELERARLQVNQFIHEQRADKSEISYMMKCFAEEKASWKSKESQVVEAAVASVVGELEVERKLRQRLESLNKKLGKELSEMKLSLVKVVKELDSEKRAREITEQMCEELARNADGERVQMKPPEAKHQFEESTSAIGKLRKQLEVFLRTKGEKEEERGGHHNVQEDDEKIDDSVDRKDGSEESDLLELNMDNSKGPKWASYTSVTNEIKPRSSIVSLRNSPLQRSASDGVEVFDRDGVYELEREAPRRSHYDGTQRNKSVKSLVKDHKLSSSRLSISQKNEQSWPSRDPFNMLEERPGAIQGYSSKSRTAAESHSRRSKW